jgi:Transcriptional regulator, AbiEi antitoxin, Type IV TA system
MYGHFQHRLKVSNMVKSAEVKLLDQAEEAVRDCLEPVVSLAIKRTRREPRRDTPRPAIVFTLKTSTGDQVVLVDVKGSGQPRIVRDAINQLLRYQSETSGAYGVLVAPYISPQSARLCVENGIGYVDLAGNCRLSFGSVYVERDGKPNPAPQRRELRSLYAPRTTRVLRVLLRDPKKPWRLQPLAQEAGVSLGQAYNVKKLLADREWIRSEEGGLRLADPRALLQEWSQHYTYRKNAGRDFYSLDTPPEVERKLAAACRDAAVPYAFTGFSAAARLAPMVRYQRVMAYISGDPTPVVTALSLKEVPSGANVTLLSPHDDGVFYGTAEVGGLQMVAPVQVYLDLVGYRGRGEEAAAFVLEQVIEHTW